MIELNLVDGKKIYIPLSRVYQVSEDSDGMLVVAVDAGEEGKVWHNISSFAILREGQKVGH